MGKLSKFLFFSFIIANVIFSTNTPSQIFLAELINKEIEYTVGYFESTPKSFFENIYFLSFENIPLKSQEMIVNITREIKNSIYAKIKFKRLESSDVILDDVNITNKLIWSLNSTNQWVQYANLYDNKQEFNASLDLYAGIFTLSFSNDSKIEKIEVDINQKVTILVKILPLNLDESKSLWISISNPSSEDQQGENPEGNIDLANIAFVSAAILILLIPVLYTIYKLIMRRRGKI